MADSMNAYLHCHIEESIATLDAFSRDERLVAQLETVARTCVAALRGGKKILLAGNGGSAADAQHLAAEFISRQMSDRDSLPAIALTTDTSVLTAVGNDYGYEQVFARQINGLAQAGDVFFAISTSGRSPNVLRALEAARRKGLVTVGLTGRTGGEMPDLCDHCLRVPSDATPLIQQCHIVIGHAICALVEREIFAPPPSAEARRA